MKLLKGKTKKGGAVPKMKNPPPPPPPRLENGGFTPEPGRTANPLKGEDIIIKLPVWKYVKKHSEHELAVFISQNKIQPRFIYPTASGSVVAWYLDNP